jgi:polyhydroxybutyrate depolymerase
MKNLILLLILSTSAAHSQQTINASITHGGLQRDYILYVPANYTGTQNVPLLFNFHGYTSNASEQMFYGDFRAIADTAGFIIVHPEGKLDGSGQTHFNVGWGGSSIDDLGFTSALIDSLMMDYAIDADRVYSTGMSNGGFMSFHLACNLSNRIAAIASVTGSMVPSTMSNCAASHPTAIMQIHGTSDGTVPYNGGSGISASIPSVLTHWSNYNNTDATAITTAVPNTNTSDGCTAEKIAYLNGDNCTEVVHYKITGGAHTWPGAPITIGVTNRDINASTEIWKFVSRYDINGLRATCALSTSALENEAFELYPNPANNVITLKGTFLEALNYEIIDALGKVVATGNVNTTNNTIDISKLKADVYFLKLDSRTLKIVKTND